MFEDIAATADGYAKPVEEPCRYKFASDQEIKALFDGVRRAIAARHRAAVGRALERWRAAPAASLDPRMAQAAAPPVSAA